MTSSASVLEHSPIGLSKPSMVEERPQVVDRYGLTRDKTESARLNAQHDVWKANIGFLLHPRFASSLGKSPRIGDIGTGTGIWILEVASQIGQHSGATFEGLDMSAEQFPPGPHDTVKFSTLNLLEPVPVHLQGTFDVLHLRLLVLGLPGGTWELACQNIFSLLKPGGWVQWEEANFFTMGVYQNHPGASTRAAREYYDRLSDEERARGHGLDDVPHLASHMSNVGFKDVTVDVFSSDRVASTRNAFNDSMVGAYHGITQMFVKNGGKDSFWASEASVKLFQDMVSELADAKAYYRSDINVVCAQKPQ